MGNLSKNDTVNPFSKRRTQYDRKGKKGKLTPEELEKAGNLIPKWKVVGVPFELNQWGTLTAFPKKEGAEQQLLPKLTPFVKVLDARVFQRSELLRDLVLPEGLERIPPQCFIACENLKKVFIPDSVKEIMEAAFADCAALEEITLPKGLEEIPSYCFANCSGLKTVKLPDKVQEIGAYAFDGCAALEEITLPKGLEEIPSYCFANCSGLKTVMIPDTEKKIGEGAFADCAALEEIKLPKDLKKIPQYCFTNCFGLKTVKLPDKVQEIGAYAFDGCAALEEITLPEGLERIPPRCFSACETLKTVVIPDTVKEIGEGAFADCAALEEIKLPKDLKKIPQYCFTNCFGLKTVKLPDKVQEIGAYAFDGCTALEEITLPEGLRCIPAECFSACSQLKTVGLPDGLEFVGKGAFRSCDALGELRFGDRLRCAVMPWGLCLTPEAPRVVLPDTASFYTEKDAFGAYSGTDFNDIFSDIFDDMGLNSFENPFSYRQEAPLPLRSPEDGAMRFRSGLRSEIPFDDQGDLKEYYLWLSESTDMPIIPRSADYAAFRESFTELKAASELDIVFGGSGMPAFAGAILSEGITEIPSGAFAGLKGFRAIRLPSTMKRICRGAFEGCIDLQFINLFPGIEIETGAFDGCDHIAWVYDDELRGGSGSPTAAEQKDLIHKLHQALCIRGVLINSPELRYLKALLPRIVIRGEDGEMQLIAGAQKKLIAKLNRKHEIGAPLPNEQGRIVAVHDPRLREAVHLAARYEQRYLCMWPALNRNKAGAITKN